MANGIYTTLTDVTNMALIIYQMMWLATLLGIDCQNNWSGMTLKV